MTTLGNFVEYLCRNCKMGTIQINIMLSFLINKESYTAGAPTIDKQITINPNAPRYCSNHPHQRIKIRRCLLIFVHQYWQLIQIQGQQQRKLWTIRGLCLVNHWQRRTLNILPIRETVSQLLPPSVCVVERITLSFLIELLAGWSICTAAWSWNTVSSGWTSDKSCWQLIIVAQYYPAWCWIAHILYCTVLCCTYTDHQ